MYGRKIYIEPETIKKANDNLKHSIEESKKAIDSGAPDDIRASVADVIQNSQDLRAFLCANYNLRFK